MARAGTTVHETVNVAGSSAADVSARVAMALARTEAYQLVELGPARHQVVRAYRPTWALVVGTFCLPLFGLGLLFLLVRRTESCTIAALHGPVGLVLSIDGRLLKLHVDDARRAALDHGSRTPAQASQTSSPEPGLHSPIVVPPAATAPASVPGLDVTVARGKPLTSRPEQLALRLSDGRCLPLVGRVVIGRDPAYSASGRVEETLVSIDDPSMSLSKTHLVVRADGGRVLVEDLHSTNGTEVAPPGGERQALTPGQPAGLTAGSRLHFGGHVAEVVTSG